MATAVAALAHSDQVGQVHLTSARRLLAVAGRSLKLVESSGKPIAEVARSLGIAEGTLWNWVRAADRPNARWVADITEFPTGEGKLYLAAIRDLCHRGIVGWDTAGRQDAALVVSALTIALARTGNPANVIHHADKGTQYTSLDFAFAAGHADMQLSFGSTGDAYDNAAMETFWARLKVEITWIHGSIWFEARAAAHAHLFEFIEVFYNRQRHQAGLGHLTPAEYADKRRHDHGQPNLA